MKNWINFNRFLTYIKNKRQQAKLRRSVWVCSCGCVIPKKGALLSGGPQYKYDYHVHCPKCDRIIDQFVKPSEVQ